MSFYPIVDKEYLENLQKINNYIIKTYSHSINAFVFNNDIWTNRSYKNIKDYIRFELLKLQKGRCFYCKRKIQKSKYNPGDIEHILIKDDFKYLSFYIYNLVITCKDCNLNKGKEKLSEENPYNFIKLNKGISKILRKQTREALQANKILLNRKNIKSYIKYVENYKEEFNKNKRNLFFSEFSEFNNMSKKHGLENIDFITLQSFKPINIKKLKWNEDDYFMNEYSKYKFFILHPYIDNYEDCIDIQKGWVYQVKPGISEELEKKALKLIEICELNSIKILEKEYEEYKNELYDKVMKASKYMEMINTIEKKIVNLHSINKDFSGKLSSDEIELIKHSIDDLDNYLKEEIFKPLQEAIKDIQDYLQEHAYD